MIYYALTILNDQDIRVRLHPSNPAWLSDTNAKAEKLLATVRRNLHYQKLPRFDTLEISKVEYPDLEVWSISECTHGLDSQHSPYSVGDTFICPDCYQTVKVSDDDESKAD